MSSCHETFAARALEFGEVSDRFIHDTLTEAGIDMAQFEIRGADEKPLDDKVINQRRVCCLTSPHFQASDLQKAAAKAQTVADAAAAAADKAAKKVQKEVLDAQAREKAVRPSPIFVPLDAFECILYETCPLCDVFIPQIAQANRPKTWVCANPECSERWLEGTGICNWKRCDKCLVKETLWFCPGCDRMRVAHQRKCRERRTALSE